MQQVITTEQLAEEINERIRQFRYYTNKEVFFAEKMVDFATAVNDRTIRLDFHWVEQAKPAFVNYATEDWTKLTDQIEVFRLLKYLNETFLQYQRFPNDKDAIKILTVQYSIMALGFSVMC